MDLKENVNNNHTSTEIEGQSDLWIKTINSLHKNERIKEFINPLFEKNQLNIILTGAGSSAYIGETVEHLFRLKDGINSRAISTTTLVTHFKTYVDCKKPLLLISFARSGNSPESIAAVDLANSLCDEVHHIAITCNETGKLAKQVM